MKKRGGSRNRNVSRPRRGPMSLQLKGALHVFLLKLEEIPDDKFESYFVAARPLTQNSFSLKAIGIQLKAPLGALVGAPVGAPVGGSVGPPVGGPVGG